MSTRRSLAVAAAALLAAACSSAPTGRGLAEEAVAAMGGADALRGVQTLVMSGGTGSRTRIGQSQKAGGPDATGQLSNVIETLDLANGRAALDYEFVNDGFMQHRQEVLTKKGNNLVGLENVAGRPLAVMSPSGLFSWGTQNSPEFLLRRNAITVALAAASTAPETAPEQKSFNGRTLQSATATLPSGESATVFFEPESKLLAGYEVLDTESMLGDVTAQYVLEDYKPVGALTLPHRITIIKGGQPYSQVQFASAAVNDEAALSVFAIPESANAEADTAIAAGDYSSIALDKVADGTWFARAYSHNSLVVEFPTFLAVVEAAYTDAQSHTLARVLQQQFPGKPIRYAALTHHHYDHTGGVRGLASYGATILLERGQEPEMRPVLEAPHTNPPDALETKKAAGEKVPAIEVFEGKKVVSEGRQSLELYAITGNPHVEPKVVAFVPSSGVLFQSDIFFPGTGAPASPAAAHLLESVRALKLRVRTHAGGHGGVGPAAELEKAVAAMK
jgi:glyoxylase-like metal-dependent hydrolase (beta-lactamase superfamily II)